MGVSLFVVFGGGTGFGCPVGFPLKATTKGYLFKDTSVWVCLSLLNPLVRVVPKENQHKHHPSGPLFSDNPIFEVRSTCL